MEFNGGKSFELISGPGSLHVLLLEQILNLAHGRSETSVDVSLSDHFFGWIFALGPSVKIVSPAKAVRQFRNELDAMRALYK